MSGEPRAGRGVDAVCGAMALALLALLLGFSVWLWRGLHQPLLLAPAIGGLSDCLEMAAPAAPLEAACAGPQGSAAARIDTAHHDGLALHDEHGESRQRRKRGRGVAVVVQADKNPVDADAE